MWKRIVPLIITLLIVFSFKAKSQVLTQTYIDNPTQYYIDKYNNFYTKE